MSIQLVLQCSGNSARMEIPGQWTKKDSIHSVLISIKDRLFGVDMSRSSIRYLQTVINSSEWETTTLTSIGIDEGRALLILQQNTNGSDTKTTASMQEKRPIDPLETALQRILTNNFDVDSRVLLLTILKIIDNILSKPHDPKLRLLKLSNPILHKKVFSKQGAVDLLIASGFQKSYTNTTSTTSLAEEECFLLSDTSRLVTARKFIVAKATLELQMTADELPKLKPVSKAPPPPQQPVVPFDPYKGHRHDAKSAAIGQSLGPDGAYVSSTESALGDIRARQARLENQLQVLNDRELVAFLPNQSAPSVGPAEVIASPTDGSLLAAHMKKQAQDRKQREEGGFTTKAMRELQSKMKEKVYASAILRIQFPDGSILSAKFLPKEKIQKVHEVVAESLTMPHVGFMLYVAPPRRALDPNKSLQEEGLVPAAKVFVSWTTTTTGMIQPALFLKVASNAFPEGMALVEQPVNPQNTIASDEDALLRRMMGGTHKATKEDKTKKPKWFKG